MPNFFSLDIKKLVPFGIWAGISVALLFGFPWESGPMNGGWELDVFGYPVRHPFLLMVAIGFLAGYWILPFVEEIYQRDKTYLDVYDKIHSQENGQMRSVFFNTLARAYNKWRVSSDRSVPQQFGDFIDQSPVPSWLNEILRDVKTNVEKDIRNNNLLLVFCVDLYNDLDNHLKTGAPAKYISDAEAVELHNARQYLNMFWEDVAFKIYGRKILRVKKMRQHIDHQSRLLKALSVLCAALLYTNRQSGVGSNFMYRLCAEEIGKRDVARS